MASYNIVSVTFCLLVSTVVSSEFYHVSESLSFLYISQFVYLFIHWWALSCFYLLTVVNNAALKMSLQVSHWADDFSSFGYIPRSGIAISYGNSVFKVLKNCYSVFCSDCNNLYSLQQCICVPISPIPHQYTLFCWFLFSFFK